MTIFSVCLDCKHFINDDSNVLKCKAYPKEIPNNIFFDKSGNLCQIKNKDGVHFEMLNKKQRL